MSDTSLIDRFRGRLASTFVMCVAVSAALIVSGTVASGATNPNSQRAAPSAQQLYQGARQYVDQAQSFRVTGTVVQAALNYRVDVTLFANGDSTGTVALNGNPAQITVIGDFYYLKGSTKFWNQSFGESFNNSVQLSAEWVAIPRAAITGLGANLSFAHVKEVFSLPANIGLTITGTANNAANVQIPILGTLQVALAAPNRPLAFHGAVNGNTDALQFSNWNAGSTPTKPSKSVLYTAFP